MFSFVAVNPDFASQLGPTVFKSIVGLVISGLLGVIMWPLRKMKSEWNAMKSEQTNIHSELVKQRENCLQTLQTQGDRQIELLGKTVDILGDVRVSIAEMAGYCKANTGISWSSKPRRHKAKK